MVTNYPDYGSIVCDAPSVFRTSDSLNHAILLSIEPASESYSLIVNSTVVNNIDWCRVLIPSGRIVLTDRKHIQRVFAGDVTVPDLEEGEVICP